MRSCRRDEGGEVSTALISYPVVRLSGNSKPKLTIGALAGSRISSPRPMEPAAAEAGDAD